MDESLDYDRVQEEVLDALRNSGRKLLTKEFEQMMAEMATTIDELAERSLFVCALEESGVDNWEGYSAAWGLMDKWSKEDGEQ